MLLLVNYKVAGRKNTVSLGNKIFFSKIIIHLSFVIHDYIHEQDKSSDID